MGDCHRHCLRCLIEAQIHCGDSPKSQNTYPRQPLVKNLAERSGLTYPANPPSAGSRAAGRAWSGGRGGREIPPTSPPGPRYSQLSPIVPLMNTEQLAIDYPQELMALSGR